MNEELKPWERLLCLGPSSLSDSDLLAVLFRIGTSQQSATELSESLLEQHDGLKGLLAADALSLQRNGLSPAKVAAVMAAVELGCRLARQEMPKRHLMEHPDRVARYLNVKYALTDQEVMGALFLDTHNRLMTEREFFRGTLSRAAVEPRQVLREALGLGATSLILFHTHPSGDPAPSAEDLGFTRRMAAAGEVLGVRLVDHLIIGLGGHWVSLAERGAW